MSIFTPGTWGITTRLVLVATVPPFLMSLVVTMALYVSGRNEVAAALQDRGELVAAALAETSRYGVISGNLAYLDRNVRQLLKTDRSVSTIEILDAGRKVLVSAGGATTAVSATFEMPIGIDAPDIDVFDSPVEPHASLLVGDGEAPFRTQAPVGFVRVGMSEAPILAEKHRRLSLGAAIVLLATLASGVAGLYLAQRLRTPLRTVMSALREIRRGHFHLTLSAVASGEMGELQATIVEMANGLSRNQRELEEKVESRTRELQQAVTAVSEADAEKRRLIARGNTMIEEERQRIAIEIHDHLNASLIVVNMKAQHIASLASYPADQEDVAEIERTAQSISATTESLYSAARAIVKQLRPEIIDTLGLKGAVAEMVRNYDELHPACSFGMHSGKLFPDLRGQPAITAYRLIQEALSNVVKHSGATQAFVRLERHASTTAVVVITITDNGRGFDTSTRPPNSVGLIGMRERVSASNGSIRIDSKPGDGTTISIELPLTEPRSAA